MMMNEDLYFYLILTGSCLPFVVLLVIWNLAGWKWKMQPVAVLSIGITVLVAGLAANIYLQHQTDEIRALLANVDVQTTPEQRKGFLGVAAAHDDLSKMLELVTIPLGVALVAAALLSKADLEFNRYMASYREVARQLNERRQRLDTLEEEMGVFIDSGQRGKLLIDKWAVLKKERHALRYAERMLRKRFRLLFKEKMVSDAEAD